MNDVMLFGVLKMPYEMAMESELSRLQFYQRVQQLVARVEAQPPLPVQRPWAELTDDEEIEAFLGEDFHTMTESEERFFKLGMQAAKEKNT